jgi:hypothetical protein
MVTPGILSLVLTAQLRLIAANSWGAAATLVLLSLPMAWFYVRCRIGGLLFWSHLHNHIMSHGGNLPSPEAQSHWYAKVGGWLVLNGLTGAASTRWLWTYQDRRKFAQLYKAVGRRQHREQLPQLSFSEDVPPEIARQFLELGKLVEELGPIAELMFYLKHRWFITIHKAVCFAFILGMPIVWLDPDLTHLKQPAESPAQNQLIALSAIRLEIGRFDVSRYQINPIVAGGEGC